MLEGLCFFSPGMYVSSSSPRSAERGIERRARTHHGARLLTVWNVIAADVGRLSLHGVELVDDLLLVVGERLRELREVGLQLAVLLLCGERLCPVEREIEMAAAVVELASARTGRLVALEQFAGSLVERRCEDFRAVVAGLDREIF